MLITETAVDVRYPDMDTVGVVHHSVYAIWYEIARMDFFEKAGIPFSQMSRYDVHPVMVNLNQNFLAPLRYPGRVVIRTSVRSFAPKKLELAYELTSEKGGDIFSRLDGSRFQILRR